jgi:hypothetical protein
VRAPRAGARRPSCPKLDRRPDEQDALRFAASWARGRLSKFEPCLPEHLASAYLAEPLTDPVEAGRALDEGMAERNAGESATSRE